MQQGRFSNRMVYITGGSSGIGLEAAKQLAALGAEVVVFARNEARLASAVQALERLAPSKQQRFGGMRLDVSHHEEVKATLQAAVQKFGPPDIFINCAGRAYPRHFEEITYEQFDDTMKVNLYGIWSTVSAILPFMKARGGRIINTSSMAGFVGVFGYTDYSASKFGIVGFSEALRAELRRYHITVSVFCPPDTDTPGFAVENQTKPEETRAISARAKLMKAEDAARALVESIDSDEFMIIPSVDGRLTFLAKRFAPRLVEWTMQKSIDKVQKSSSNGH
jgi:3-dehydrosphinganine reductase